MDSNKKYNIREMLLLFDERKGHANFVLDKLEKDKKIDSDTKKIIYEEMWKLWDLRYEIKKWSTSGYDRKVIESYDELKDGIEKARINKETKGKYLKSLNKIGEHLDLFNLEKFKQKELDEQNAREEERMKSLGAKPKNDEWER